MSKFHLFGVFVIENGWLNLIIIHLRHSSQISLHEFLFVNLLSFCFDFAGEQDFVE